MISNDKMGKKSTDATEAGAAEDETAPESSVNNDRFLYIVDRMRFQLEMGIPGNADNRVAVSVWERPYK